MDAVRFDGLTRSLSARSSRRVALGGLAAGVLTALGLALDESTVLAKKKNKGKKKKKKNQKMDCPRPGEFHLNQNQCEQLCTNFLVDPYNCGGCNVLPGDPRGKQCGGEEQCVEGECVAGDAAWSSCKEYGEPGGCRFGPAVCCAEPTGSRCRNIHFETDHCGTCNHACAAGKQPACCYGRCRDLHADPLNCGACFNRCPSDKPLCSGGTCHKTCSPGLTQCGNTCFHQPTEACCNGRVIAKEDLQFDDKNCGACGRECSAFSTSPGECCGGVCLDFNFPDCCGGQRANLNFDDDNCGACGTVCRSPSLCVFGACN
ncbi:MAG: hypothetical protein ACRDJC_19720 [Thermomicrobiales bacterium]